MYNRALSEEEAAVLPLLETAAEIAAMPPARRTPAQAKQTRLLFH